MYMRLSKPISRSMAGFFVAMWLFFMGASFVHTHNTASESTATSIQADSSCPVCTWQQHSEQAQVVVSPEAVVPALGDFAYLCPTFQAPKTASAPSQSRAPPFQVSLSLLA